MAEPTAFTDEMLEQIVGGNIYTSREEFQEYCNKLKELLDKLSSKYGTDKVMRVVVMNDEFKGLLSDGNADQMLDVGLIEQHLEIAISQL